MIDEKALLPSELFRKIWLEQNDPDPGRVYRQIKQSYQKRDARLTAIDPGVYYAPLPAVLRLYRIDASRFRDWVVSSLGVVRGADDHAFWRRLAAAARDAFREQDWTLLGRLAFCADRALMQTQGDRSEPALPSPDWYEQTGELELVLERDEQPRKTTGIEVINAFKALCNLERCPRPRDDYFEIALAYFAQLPTGLVVPPELLRDSRPPQLPKNDEQAATAIALQRPLLCFFWRSYHGDWKERPEALQRLENLSNPFLAILADQIRASDAAPVEPEEPDTSFSVFQTLADRESYFALDERSCPLDEKPPARRFKRRRRPWTAVSGAVNRCAGWLKQKIFGRKPT